jgi:hypothetical protein
LTDGAVTPPARKNKLLRLFKIFFAALLNRMSLHRLNTVTTPRCVGEKTDTDLIATVLQA